MSINIYEKKAGTSSTIAFKNFLNEKRQRVESLKEEFDLDYKMSYKDFVYALCRKIIQPKLFAENSVFVQAYNDAQLALIDFAMAKNPGLQWVKTPESSIFSARLSGGYNARLYDDSAIIPFMSETYEVENYKRSFKEDLFLNLEFSTQRIFLTESLLSNIYGRAVDAKRSLINLKESFLTTYIVELKYLQLEFLNQAAQEEGYRAFRNIPISLETKLGSLIVNKEVSSTHKERAKRFELLSLTEGKESAQAWIENSATVSKNDPRIVDDSTIEKIKIFLSWAMVNNYHVNRQNYQGLLYFYSQMFTTPVNYDLIQILDEDYFFILNKGSIEFSLSFPNIERLVK